MIDFIPHSYQLTAKNHVLSNPESALFLDMGLGKTVISLSAICDLFLQYKVRKVLVVAPLRVANTVWKQEASKWIHTSWLNVTIVTGTKRNREKALAENSHIYVINYDILKWLCEFYDYKLPFDMLVLDELTKVKSHTSLRFKALKKARYVFKYILGLTGTPISNGYTDLWGEMYMIDGGKRLSAYISYYREAFFYKTRIGASEHALEYVLRDGAADTINNRIADICLSMKASDYLNLPPLIEIDEYVDLTPEIFKQYKKFERDKIVEFHNEKIQVDSAAQLSKKLLQWTNGACYYDEFGKEHVEIHHEKIERLLTLIEKANGEPMLVAYQFKHDIERIMYYVKSVYPDLEVRRCNSDKDIEDWNNKKINVFLAHPQSAGYGLNLQFGGSIIVWFGLTWSLEEYLQFIGRIHRQGITVPVRMYRILARNTYDEIVRAALVEKDEVQNKLLEYINNYQKQTLC